MFAKLNPICLGLDPDFAKMPAFLKPKNPQNKQEVKNKLREFLNLTLDYSLDLVDIFKIQIAYFEALGLAGLEVLLEIKDRLHKQGKKVILDIKRGDIGSTSEAYAKAYLDSQADFNSDAITINPFLGMDSLEPFIDSAIRNQKMIFVLAKTSNFGSGDFQDAQKIEQKGLISVTDWICKWIQNKNLETGLIDGYGRIGLVIGATRPEIELKKYRLLAPNCLFLMPGIGSQGGTLQNINSALNVDNTGAIFPISRDILYPKKLTTNLEDYLNLIRFQIELYINQWKSLNLAKQGTKN